MRVLMCALALVTTQAHASLVACTDDNISNSFRSLVESGQRIEDEGEFLLQLYRSQPKSLNYIFDPAAIDYSKAFERHRFLQEQWLDQVIETRMWVDKCPKSSQTERKVSQYQTLILNVMSQLRKTNEEMPNANK